MSLLIEIYNVTFARPLTFVGYKQFRLLYNIVWK